MPTTAARTCACAGEPLLSLPPALRAPAAPFPMLPNSLRLAMLPNSLRLALRGHNVALASFCPSPIVPLFLSMTSKRAVSARQHGGSRWCLPRQGGLPGQRGGLRTPRPGGDPLHRDLPWPLLGGEGRGLGGHPLHVPRRPGKPRAHPVDRRGAQALTDRSFIIQAPPFLGQCPSQVGSLSYASPVSSILIAIKKILRSTALPALLSFSGKTTDH